jgi:XTP/dITP diphosphohydrolase
MISRLVIGSRNQKKIKEMRALIVPAWNTPVWANQFEVIGLEGFPNAPDPDETGETFQENARIKASEFAKSLGQWVLADDSGLTVDALGGRPGVYSARYAGKHGDDAANNQKVLDELQGVPAEGRGAAFVCRLAIADPEGNIRLEAGGKCRGRIIQSLVGTHGFGYDPLFLIPEYHQTFGQLPPVVKNQLSHRCRAFEHLRRDLDRLIRGN